MKRLPLVYVAGPFRGPTSWAVEQNVRRAEELSLLVWEAGAACICPHANTRFFQGEAADSVWLDGDLEIMRRCDAVVLTPGWPFSNGALAEKAEAERLGIPVFDTVFALRVWIAAKKAELDSEDTVFRAFAEAMAAKQTTPDEIPFP
jgi:hypothetical protein